MAKRKKSNQNFSYEMFGEKISQQDDYNYLGLLFSYNGNFYKARKKLVDQAQKVVLVVILQKLQCHQHKVIKTISYIH
jgi:hypothetical protein